LPQKVGNEMNQSISLLIQLIFELKHLKLLFVGIE